MVQPRGEDSQPAQLAPVLVWHDVVRIVAPGPFIAERTNHLPRDPTARQRPVRSVVPRNAIEIPLRYLCHGVAMLRIQTVQPIDRNLH